MSARGAGIIASRLYNRLRLTSGLHSKSSQSDFINRLGNSTYYLRSYSPFTTTSSSKCSATPVSVEQMLVNMSSSRPLDQVRIQNLSIHLPHGLGPSAFNLLPPPPCPIVLNVTISLRKDVVPNCVQNDNMNNLGVNYSSVSKGLIALTASQSFAGPWELVRAVGEDVGGGEVVRGVEVELGMPKALLNAGAAVYRASFAAKPISAATDGAGGGGGELTIQTQECGISNLRVMTIIGLHPHERLAKQALELDLWVKHHDVGKWDHKAVADDIYRWLEESSYGTIEALVDCLAKYLLGSSPSLNSSSTTVQPPSSSHTRPSITITLRKPSAMPYATPVISITRSHDDYIDTPSQGALPTVDTIGDEGKRVFVAIGSNLGDRIAHLSKAVTTLSETAGVKLTNTSRLYESEPMYVEDQSRFINGVIELSTTLTPLDLLRQLKRIEKDTGRTKTFRNGPRVVDLDLVFYGDQVVQVGQPGDAEDADGVGWLECPHPRLSEREFVLRPLNDLAPELIHPTTGQTVAELLHSIPGPSNPSKPALAPIIPFPSPASPLRLESSPRVMQIFNATPDSFSDGSQDHLDLTLAMKAIEGMFATPHPPDILDIGGMSTRPNSTPCTEKEELERVLPLIRAIRSSANELLAKVAISIDTYRPTVARRAVEAGASCINDVRGGRESGMMATMAESGVPVVLMHSRGDSTSMLESQSQDYASFGGVVQGVKAELKATVRRALDTGVRKWNIVIDPGLGFAKNHHQNLELIRRIDELAVGSILGGVPVLLGGSRKGFVGRVIKRGTEEVSLRGYGDAAVVTWCCAKGVEVVRVHDGRGMSEVIKMHAAIRSPED